MSENNLIPPAIGIDFGATTVKIAVVENGELTLTASPIQTQGYPGPDPLLAAIFLEIERLRREKPSIAGIGMGLPGLVENGVVHNLTNVKGWVNIPIASLLEEKTGLPAIADNDANAMAYAEWRFGAAKGSKNAICLTLGTGLGAGLILDGKLFHGSRFAAGELGMMMLEPKSGVDGPYGNAGFVESYLGLKCIAMRAVELYQQAGQNRTEESCDPIHLSQAARQGDLVANQVWKEAGETLGLALANVLWLLNLDTIVIGGGIAKAGDLLFQPIRATINRCTHPVIHEKLSIFPAHYENNAGIVGAATLALGERGSAPPGHL